MTVYQKQSLILLFDTMKNELAKPKEPKLKEEQVIYAL